MHFATLLSGNNTASGIIHFHDFLIITTEKASEFIDKQGESFTHHLHSLEPRSVSQQLLSKEDAITVVTLRRENHKTYSRVLQGREVFENREAFGFEVRL